ncbi:hypothetical protein PR048_006306 [Dryococelus australis]|uniref:Uncharacterized protein n=1 Tax=Dryococelus australis TaxID=614101 RepID=A0ABQ9IBM4_9NEOP|nr:hypothetical protein PR048_006306 [Dryococelus australis]
MNCLFKNITPMFLIKSIGRFLRLLVSIIVFPRCYTRILCDSMKEKLKAVDTQEESCILEIDKFLHLNRADAYCAAKQIHFKRKTWKHTFLNLGDDSATMYLYCEHEGKKGPNELTSMLLDYVNHNREDEIKELILTSHGCPKIFFKWPQEKITTSAELPVDWDSVICNARKYSTPFSLRMMTYDDFKEMKAATDPFFLKTPKPPLQLKETRMLQVVKGESTLRIKNTYSGLWATHIVHSRQSLVPNLEIPALYQYNPEINPAKANDLAKLMAYLECPTN